MYCYMHPGCFTEIHFLSWPIDFECFHVCLIQTQISPCTPTFTFFYWHVDAHKWLRGYAGWSEISIYHIADFIMRWFKLYLYCFINRPFLMIISLHIPKIFEQGRNLHGPKSPLAVTLSTTRARVSSDSVWLSDLLQSWTFSSAFVVSDGLIFSSKVDTRVSDKNIDSAYFNSSQGVLLFKFSTSVSWKSRKISHWSICVIQ